MIDRLMHRQGRNQQLIIPKRLQIPRSEKAAVNDLYLFGKVIKNYCFFRGKSYGQS